MSCSIGCRFGSDPRLLWLRRRPVATALIQPLAWESPLCYGYGPKKQSLKKEKKKGSQLFDDLTPLENFGGNKF